MEQIRRAEEAGRHQPVVLPDEIDEMRGERCSFLFPAQIKAKDHRAGGLRIGFDRPFGIEGVGFRIDHGQSVLHKRSIKRLFDIFQ